jgi:hypothetical protein
MFVTFHQSYSYEDFVEGLWPVSDADGSVRYEVKAGVFKRLCRWAQQDVAMNDGRSQESGDQPTPGFGVARRKRKTETESDEMPLSYAAN